MNICFATNNRHKLIEVKKLLSTDFEILSLKEIGCHEELPENQNTLQGNANEKARFVYDRFKVNCFADDTGLEVESLNGSPGVYSARYAGLQRSDADNIDLLLKNLEGQNNRKARFRTVISLIIENKEIQFEGIVNGTIANEIQGEDGFGYDPVFLPEGQDKTFAQMSMEEKNQISHRGIATRKLVVYLNKYN